MPFLPYFRQLIHAHFCAHSLACYVGAMPSARRYASDYAQGRFLKAANRSCRLPSRRRWCSHIFCARRRSPLFDFDRPSPMLFADIDIFMMQRLDASHLSSPPRLMPLFRRGSLPEALVDASPRFTIEGAATWMQAFTHDSAPQHAPVSRIFVLRTFLRRAIVKTIRAFIRLSR